MNLWKLSALALVTVTIAACHDWDTELTQKLHQLDGEADAGTDGGATDGGCKTPLCLVYTLPVRQSDEFRNAMVLGSGTFAVLADSVNFPPYLAVIRNGGAELTPLNAGTSIAWNIAGNSSNEFFLGLGSGAVRYGDGGVLEKTTQCGHMLLTDPDWYSVSSGNQDEAVWVRGGSEVCTWLSGTTHFTGYDFSPLVATPAFLNLVKALSLPTGERFFGANEGGLVYWKAPGEPMLYRHTLASTNHATFTALAGPDINSVWALADNGAVARWVPNSGDGGRWEDRPSIPFFEGSVRDVWVRNNADIWVAANQGKLMHYDGTRWSEVPAEGLNLKMDINVVLGSGPDDLLVAGAERPADGGFRSMLLFYHREN